MSQQSEVESCGTIGPAGREDAVKKRFRSNWGLHLIMQRAQKIGASFLCQSSTGVGTEVRVSRSSPAGVRPAPGRAMVETERSACLTKTARISLSASTD
jgi:hypothetical protein